MEGVGILVLELMIGVVVLLGNLKELEREDWEVMVVVGVEGVVVVFLLVVIRLVV